MRERRLLVSFGPYWPRVSARASEFNFIFLLPQCLPEQWASVAGFGIGSILTPLLAIQMGTKVAVAAISIPHFIATVIRFWLIRRQVNRKAPTAFGTASAAGGLVGAVFIRFSRVRF